MPDYTPPAPKSERILNAAEELFALHGFDGVTLRRIATAAEVDVALLNYHFGVKKKLFEAVFLRRAEILNEARLNALLEAKAGSGGQPSLQQIVSAFLRPIQHFQLTGDQGWRNYLALVAWVNSSSVWGEEMMHKSFDPFVSRFIEALKKNMPDADPQRVYWAYQFLSGALTLTLAQTGRIDRLSDGLCRESNLETAYDLMIPFVVAGFRKLCLEQFESGT